MAPLDPARVQAKPQESGSDGSYRLVILLGIPEIDSTADLDAKGSAMG
ncbi:hypothetical protein [Streptomyces sp. NBC_00690]|nr:hypothetical protein [Streptomyces sp. NBC_00690]